MATLKTFGFFLVLINLATADLRDDALNVHNEYRSRHGSRYLSLSNELNNYAQDYANTLAREEKLRPSGGKYGENLYTIIGGSSEFPDSKIAIDAVRLWYSKESKYNYDSPGFSKETATFTAVVWRSTKLLGMGIARRGNKTYVVASYDPAGNLGGQFKENVLHPNCLPEEFLRWVTPDETLPAEFYPVDAGVDVDGQTLGICRAKQYGDLIPGKLMAGGNCLVGYEGSELIYKSHYRYAVFRKVNGCPSLSWVNRPSEFDEGVRGGETWDGQLLLVSRCPLPEFGQNVTTPGKIYANDKSKAYFSFAGREFNCSNYDVLMTRFNTHLL